jgi:hypothetical protein
LGLINILLQYSAVVSIRDGRTRACSHYGRFVLMFVDGDHGSTV